MVVLIIYLLHFILSIASIVIVVLPLCAKKPKSIQEATTPAVTTPTTNRKADEKALTPTKTPQQKTKTPQQSHNKGCDKEWKKQTGKRCGDNILKQQPKHDEKEAGANTPMASPVEKPIKPEVVKSTGKDVITNPFITEMSDEFPTVEETK